MSDNVGLPPPGWFADPGGSGQLRWWDGAQWTQHTHPVPAAQPAYPASYGWVDPQAAVRDERATARWARNAIVVYALLLLGSIYVGVRLFREMSQGLQEIAANPEVVPADPNAMLGMDGSWFALSQLFNGLQLGIFVLLLVWCYRAAEAGRVLGIPARRSPGWAAGGWFIPVVNLWFPCQSLRDMLPSDHPTRGRILVLWIVAIVAQLVAVVGLVGALVAAEWTIVAVVGSLVVAGALIAGRMVIDDILACHEELATRGRA